MHTFLQRDDGNFDVGMWLPNAEGRTAFLEIATVAKFEDALRLVNFLNGGHSAIADFAIAMPE